MRCPSQIRDENQRIHALNQYGLKDGSPLPSLDSVVRIAAQMFDIPAAAVNMIGSDTVFLAANHGVGDFDNSRDVSFCAHAITQDDVLVVPDTHLDERFHDNPLVTGPANIRFYAGVPLRSPDGHAIGVLCVIDGKPRQAFRQQERENLKGLASLAVDKLELRRLEVATGQGKSDFQKIAVSSPNAIVCFDQDLKITAWNRAATLMFGYSENEAVDRQVEMLMPESNQLAFRQDIERIVASGVPAVNSAVKEVTGLRQDGTRFPIEFSPSCWEEGGRLHFGAILLDVTERRQQAEALMRIAHFDDLTGLSNRTAFVEALADHLKANRPASVLVIDIDGFKDINDTLGYGIGDAILQEVGERLKTVLRACDLVSRISGDTFGVLLSGVGDVFSATSGANDVMAALARPIILDGNEIRITAGCGVAICPSHSTDPDELMANADLALFEAKKSGHGAVSVFVTAMRMAAQARRMYDVELHRAVENEAFELFYQPQIRLKDQKLVGAEALIRWRHPDRGLLLPSAFLPALEVSPLAASVGTWVLDTACAQAAVWQRQGHQIRMGVNLFAAQFRADDLVSRVMTALRTYDLPPGLLELEITENIILDRDDLVLEPLQKLHAAGVGIAFDDFGTGYGSLSLLKRYPLTRIKIDRSFVSTMCEAAKDDAIVSSLIAMAQGCELDVVAEGVETVQQRDWLNDKGCEEGQGFLFGKPVRASEFERLLSGVGMLTGRRA
ncbi:putative bifunctional diguanylate cyclase/phosphodiesterase [Asticcacaulis tiandongensis]|uniref:putative bifunctional diguanylate cyclase/phosphodiesterase n=1 Tax=Asticcacaulis tiandongensis TaxID=2565365 RepID=UPI00112DF212|nr:EAL domain-containing protein [Asticcacaulis tiandongensis]